MALPGDINYMTDPWDVPGGDQSQKGLGDSPSPKLGLASPPAPTGSNPWDQPGGDLSQKGLASPPLGSDLSWQGSNPAAMTAQYQALDPARQQEYVKSWLGLDPQTQAQWAAAFGYGPQANGNIGGTGTPAYGPISGNPALGQQGNVGMAGGGTLGQQGTGGYSSGGTLGSGVSGGMALGQQGTGGYGSGGALGQQGNAGMAGGGTLGQQGNAGMGGGGMLGGTSPQLGSDFAWQGATPQSLATQWQTLPPARQQEYINAYMGLDPGTQAQWRAAFGWQQPQAAAPTAPAAPTPAPAAPAAPTGPRGSLSAAMASGQQAGQGPMNPMTVPGTSEVTSGGQGNNWVGGPYSHEAYWADPSHQRRGGGMQYAPGMGAGQGGQTMGWEGGTPPGSSYTTGGQADMNAPLTSNAPGGIGQNFTGLQDFLKYMMTSTPGEQAIKRQLEGRNAQGNTLVGGEPSLFNQVAPYLTENATQFPAGATPFTNWDPSGLLQLLLKSGVLIRPTG